MIETEYTIEWTDYKDAQWLYLRTHPWNMTIYVTLLWVLPVVTLGFVGWAIVLWLSPAAALRSGVTTIAAGLLWAVLVFRFSRWYQMRRGYRNLFPEGKPPVTRFHADEEQLVSIIPDESEGRFFWSRVLAFAADERTLLLYVRRRLFLMLPRRAMNGDQRLALFQLLEAKGIPDQRKGRSRSAMETPGS